MKFPSFFAFATTAAVMLALLYLRPYLGLEVHAFALEKTRMMLNGALMALCFRYLFARFL